MGSKISYALKKCKSIIIIVLILWILLSIVFVAPMTVSIVESTVEGQFNMNIFWENVFTNFEDVGGNLGKVFAGDYISVFFKSDLYLIIVLLFFATIGFVKTMPKHDYADIEHGSSDWANGEQYSILNKNKGIILAEKHYLPVDKRGNVNVLVVGRFWFW